MLKKMSIEAKMILANCQKKNPKCDKNYDLQLAIIDLLIKHTNNTTQSHEIRFKSVLDDLRKLVFNEKKENNKNQTNLQTGTTFPHFDTSILLHA